MKRIIYVIIVIFSIFLISCKQESSSKMKIEGKDTIEIGFENEYKAYYEEEELDSDEFFWIIDNTNAVKRKGNMLVGISEGTVNLKAVLKSDGTIFASKTIEVIDSIVESISLRGTKTEVEVGTQFIVTIITEPFEAIDEVTSRWSASNDIVEIDPANDSAIITAKSEGVVTITVECSSAIASFELKVNKVITEIEMYNDNEAMVNTSTYLSFNIDDPVIELLTENVEITNNYLYAKEAGVAKIKVSQKNNKKLSAKVFEINVVNNKDLSLNITQDEQKIIDSYLNKMSTKDKISQMFMLNLDFTQSGWRRIQYTFEIDENGLYYFGNNDISSKKYVASLINNYHFGGLKLCVNTSETESEISNIVLGMQRYYLSSNLPGGIISYYNKYNEEYGGLINTLSNLTLGTINNPKTAENYYLNLGESFASAGINSYIGGFYAYNGMEENAYSYIPNKQITYSSIAYNTMLKNGVSIIPLYESNADDELIKSAIYGNDCALAINGDGNNAEKLRSLGFNGLILDTTIHYDGSRYHQYESRWDLDYEFYYDTDYYKRAINSGTNMFNICIYLESTFDRRNYANTAKNEETFNFLSSLEEMVRNNEIDINKINESVSKILLYKIRNNMIEGTFPMDNYEISDENKNYINSINNGYNTIAVEGKTLKISKNSKIKAFCTDDETATLLNKVSTQKYKEFRRYQVTSDNIDLDNSESAINSIGEGDIVLLFLYSDVVTYRELVDYEDENGEKYQYYEYHYIDAVDLYNMLKAKSENIILIFTANQYPCFETSLKDENCMKVFLNNQAHDSLNSLFEVLEKGNATGVTLYQR